MNYKLAAKGALGNFLQTGGEKLINLALFSYLARVLPLEIFGFTAAFMIFVEVGIMVSGAGLASGLISCKKITVSITNTAFTVVTAISISFFLPICIFSNQISSFLGFEKKGFYLVLVVLILIVQSLGSIPKALLLRRFQFSTISKICFFGSICGALSALIVCSSKHFFYAIWISYFIQSLFSSFLFFIFAKYLPGFYFSREAFNALKRISFSATFSSFLSMLTDKIIPISIGKFLGPGELGLYSIILRPCAVVWQLVISSMQKTFLPLFATGDSSLKESHNLAKLFYPLFIFVLPSCLFLLLFSKSILSLLFGSEFQIYSLLLGLGAANLFVLSFNFMNESLLLTSSDPSRVIILGSLRLLLILGLIYFTISYSLTAILLGHLFVNLFFLLSSLLYLRFFAGIDLISSLVFCLPLLRLMGAFACLALLFSFSFSFFKFSFFFSVSTFFLLYLFFMLRILKIPLFSSLKSYKEAIKALI